MPILHDGITEKAFLTQVVQLARLHGYMVYHTFNSRKSSLGFPDLVMIREGRLIVAELKVGRNRLTPEQETWITLFRSSDVLAYVWRPTDWDMITQVLRGEVHESNRL